MQGAYIQHRFDSLVSNLLHKFCYYLSQNWWRQTWKFWFWSLSFSFFLSFFLSFLLFLFLSSPLYAWLKNYRVDINILHAFHPDPGLHQVNATTYGSEVFVGSCLQDNIYPIVGAHNSLDICMASMNTAGINSQIFHHECGLHRWVELLMRWLTSNFNLSTTELTNKNFILASVWVKASNLIPTNISGDYSEYYTAYINTVYIKQN